MLVTRPAHQADTLCRALAAAGGMPLRFPVIAIEPVALSSDQRRQVERLAQVDIVLFISPNAVHHGAGLLPRNAPPPNGPALAAVGKGTARELQALLGRPVDIVPSGRFDSEALLALPALQAVAGKRVVIVRGVGGRELLADTLRQRGAEVDYLEVYRRTRPDPSPHWPGRPDIITVTSGEGLDNLTLLAPEGLQAIPLLVVSQRIAEQAERLGYQRVVVSANASNEAIVEAIDSFAGDPIPQS